MAVVLDNKIYTVAVIQSRITDQGRITGRFSLDRALNLALVLKAGALPASISYLEERTVGASLGADSIRKGFFSAVAGLTAVALLMLLYYKWSGVNAVVALALNLLLVLAVLGLLWRRAYTAGNRRHRFVDRHGRGFQCLDLRAHTRGTAGRQDCPGSDQDWIREGVSHNH